MCILCSLDNHSRSKKHLENVYQLQMEMADDDKLMTAANDEVDEVDLAGEEVTSDIDENVEFSTQKSKYDH